MRITIRNWLRSFRRKLNGEEFISTKAKIIASVVFVMVVHVIYMILFSMYNGYPLNTYNLAILGLYGLLFLVIRAGRLMLVYLVTFIEMMFNAILCTVVAGWDIGFTLFISCMLPISAYFMFFELKRGQKVWIPLFSTLIAYIAYVSLYQYTSNHVPRISIDKNGISVIFMTNAFIGFLMFGAVSFEFLVEVQGSVNSLVNKNDNLGHEADVDPLTGLLNRRGMEIHLTEAMSRARVKGTLFGIIIGDIDNFKRINDTYSHECGDRALTNVAEIMKGAIRSGDAVCRWGGEEFLILVQGDGSTARMIGERIRQAIEKHSYMYNGDDIRFTMTFGVSVYEPGLPMSTIIKQADDKLYEGKTSGKNKVVL